MNIQIYGKSKCFDTKKAQRYFKERGIKFQDIDLPRFGMSWGELQTVKKALGGLDALVDQSHREAAVIRFLAEEQAREGRLLDDPTIFVTPIVRNGRQATVGFRPDVWKTWE